MPVPCRSNGDGAAVGGERQAAGGAAGRRSGVNRTGTARVCPVVRVTGSAGGVTPNGAVVEIAVMVTARVAVTVTVALAVLPTATLPKSVGGAGQRRGGGPAEAVDPPVAGADVDAAAVGGGRGELGGGADRRGVAQVEPAVDGQGVVGAQLTVGAVGAVAVDDPDDGRARRWSRWR